MWDKSMKYVSFSLLCYTMESYSILILGHYLCLIVNILVSVGYGGWLIFLETGFHCVSPEWPQTHRELPASAAQVLVLKT